jgi:uncharacterized membrane protein
MDTIITEWVATLLRWAHLIAGIYWIGSSFYFMHIDAALKVAPDIPEGKGGEAWEVHGGGFYHVRKYLIAPDRLPDELIWHKWQSYATWITGFFLLVWIYYLGAELYLIDPAVLQLSIGAAIAASLMTLILGWLAYDLLCRSGLRKDERALAAAILVLIVAVTWLLAQIFGGRATLLHVGAMIATWMTGNVLMVIIPNQRKVVASLLAKETPDPALGKQAKQRSTHNNYLTLPVVFLMISSHAPLAFMSPSLPALVALVLIAGALVRHFYNLRNAGRGNHWWTFAVAALAMLVAAGLSVLGSPAGREAVGLAALEPAAVAGQAAAPQEVADILIARCSMCHGPYPAWPGIGIAPKGVLLDTPEAVARHAGTIRAFAVLTRAMPPHNLTEMTEEERHALAAWLAAR